MDNEGDLTFWRYVLWGAPLTLTFIGGLIAFLANTRIHKIESSIKKNREVTDSLISTGNLKEKQEDARPLVSLIGVWPELEKQPVVFKCEFANVSDQVIKLGESKLCFDFIGPADRNADLTKRFPNANSNYVLTKFNFLVKANGNHTVEYRFVNENPAPQYVFDELQKGQRFLVVSGYLEYAHARSGKQYIYKFIYQVEPPDTQLGPNKLRVSLSENADL